MGFPPSSGGNVASVFTRTGAVTAAAGDYTGVASGSVGIANLALASASTVAITGPGTYFVTGTTAINIVTGAASGCVITLVASGQAAGICVVLNNATTANALSLRDNANLGIYAGESVTLVYNGTYWIEAARALKTVLAYTQITSDKNVTSTNSAAGTSVVAAPAITFDGANAIEIIFYAHLVGSGTIYCRLMTYDGATPLNEMWRTIGTTSPGTCVIKLTPTAASHTYGIFGYVDAGTGVVYAGAIGGGAASSGPAYIQINRAI